MSALTEVAAGATPTMLAYDSIFKHLSGLTVENIKTYDHVAIAY